MQDPGGIVVGDLVGITEPGLGHHLIVKPEQTLQDAVAHAGPAGIDCGNGVQRVRVTVTTEVQVSLLRLFRRRSAATAGEYTGEQHRSNQKGSSLCGYMFQTLHLVSSFL